MSVMSNTRMKAYGQRPQLCNCDNSNGDQNPQISFNVGFIRESYYYCYTYELFFVTSHEFSRNHCSQETNEGY